MLKLEWDIINNILKDTNNKNIHCHMDKKLLLEWSYCSTNYFNYCSSNCSTYEVAQIISSQDNYLKKKNTPVNSVKYQKKQIVMVELGENYNNLSYKHPCIVVDSIDDKVFIVPCTSGQAPINKVDNTIYRGYVQADVCDGFSHLTTVILKEARCIDKNQIAYAIKENGKFKKVEDDFFKNLNNNLFKLLFEGHHYRIDKQEKIIDTLKSEKEILQKELEQKSEEIVKLEKQLDILKNVALDIVE